jgi:DNA-binding LacI/PurR family transcriptional regulator
MQNLPKATLTIRDIAKAAGVSVSTVSRVLNGRKDQMAEPTRQKVEAAIREVNYVPNRMASSLKCDKSQTLGVVVPNIVNPYFAAVLRGVQDYASPKGYDIFICSSDDNAELEAHHVKTLLARRVEGLIVTTCAGDKTTYRRLIEARFPLVLLDRPIPGLSCDSVTVDNRGICVRIIDRLIELGHRYVAVVTPPCGDIGPRIDRVEGCRAALIRQGLDLPPDLLVEIGASARIVTEAVQHLVSRTPRPTALFVLNTLLAVGLMRELRRRAALADYAVVTYDDPDWCELLTPAVSAVRQPTYEIGRLVARLATERIEAPDRPYERVLLDAEFIERDLPAVSAKARP